MTFLPFPTDQGRSCISSATAFVAHLICEPAELVLLISAHGRINTDQVHMCNCSKKNLSRVLGFNKIVLFELCLVA